MKLSQIQTQCNSDEGLFIIEQININEDNGVHFEYDHHIFTDIYTKRSLAQARVKLLESDYTAMLTEAEKYHNSCPVTSFNIIELTLKPTQS